MAKVKEGLNMDLAPKVLTARRVVEANDIVPWSL